jgi:hypothetical protein
VPLLLRLRRSLPYQSHDHKKNNCAHGCCDDRGKNATATVQPKAREQRGRDERAENANKQCRQVDRSLSLIGLLAIRLPHQ